LGIGGKAIGPCSPTSVVPAARGRATSARPKTDDESAVERFRAADAYRARREWQRYEGTGQRDLFRELRERFLARHAVETGWVLDVGSGPGRFLPWVGGPRTRKVALDVSREMLGLIPRAWQTASHDRPTPDRILGNAVTPPLARGAWAEVAVLGNTIGFSGRFAAPLLEELQQLVAPGGALLMELAPSAGERSQYLARLPSSALTRLLRAPLAVVLGRLDREPFRPEPPRHETPRAFRRFAVGEIERRLRARGWELRERMAVAPALGPDAERISAVREDPKAWARLLDLEEEVGHRSERWPGAASVLVAARRPSSMRMIK